MQESERHFDHLAVILNFKGNLSNSALANHIAALFGSALIRAVGSKFDLVRLKNFLSRWAGKGVDPFKGGGGGVLGYASQKRPHVHT